MYNFNFKKDEKLIQVFEELFVKYVDKELITTVVLTDKRLMFLDYVNTNDGVEVLRIVRGINYTRYKDVYYEIDLIDIDDIYDYEYYKIILKDKREIEFNNKELYNLLKELVK